MRNKILVISPKFHPTKDGLSGHTTKLCVQMSQDSDVEIITNKENSPTLIDDIKFHLFPGKWKFLKLLKFWNTLPSRNFDHIVIQYVPSLYNKRGGINFSVVVFFIYLRLFSDSKISIIFHELYYPFSLYWKNIILHFSHKIMLTGALLSAHYAFFSTTRFLNESKNFLSGKSTRVHVPVGDNMFTGEIDKSLSRISETDHIPSFIIFGSPHPSKNFDLLFSCLETHYLSGGRFKLNIIGPTIDRLKENSSLPNNFDEYAKVYPNIQDAQVIEIFNQSDCNLAYFTDGLSTRRSSVISSFKYGLDCVSTKTDWTDNLLINHSFIHLFPTDPTEFAKEFQVFLKNYTPPTSIEREKINEYYLKNFSWETICLTIKKTWKA